MRVRAPPIPFPATLPYLLSPYRLRRWAFSPLIFNTNTAVSRCVTGVRTFKNGSNKLGYKSTTVGVHLMRWVARLCRSWLFLGRVTLLLLGRQKQEYQLLPSRSGGRSPFCRPGGSEVRSLVLVCAFFFLPDLFCSGLHHS